MPLSWLEIDTASIRSNIKAIRKQLPRGSKFMAVIKANAYGHGLLEVGKTVEKNCDYIAVFDFNDAVFLREKRIKSDLLVLGPISPEQFALAASKNIDISISNVEILEKSIAYNRRLTAHICVDTGMGRDGFVPEDLPTVVNCLKKKGSLEVKGLYGHFAAADDKAFDLYTQKQLETLDKWREEMWKIGLRPITHHSASAGSIKGLGLDMARSGIAVYGLFPSSEMREDWRNRCKLKPVLTWKTQICELRQLKKGDRISYACTHVLRRNSKIATLPIGYWDGIPRSSSGKGWFLVRRKKAPQIGRVTMNMTVLDVTDIPGVKIGDTVTVIGKDGKNSITADEWADWAGTINYEITARINPLTKKILS